MTNTDVFDSHLSSWQGYTETPWARLRYETVAHTLRKTLPVLGGGSLRVLDVGGGDGLDAMPLAAAGHAVTVVDPSEQMLALGRDRTRMAGASVEFKVGDLEGLGVLGQFDVVLCHYVLQYRESPQTDVSRLVAAVRPGGLLSLIALNPAGTVISKLLRQGPEEALAELDRPTIRTVTFEHDVLKLSAADIEAQLEKLGCTVIGRFGGRIANDLVTDDARKHEPEFFEALRRLELALCDKEPYWRMGAFWQLVAQTHA